MKLEDILVKIPFIGPNDTTILVNGGYSGAINLKLIKEDGKYYFLKIYNHFLNEEKVKQLEYSFEIYRELNIPAINLISITNIEEINYSCCLFDYIEGTNALNNPIYKDFQKSYELGLEIGKELAKLKNYNFDKSKFKVININSLTKKISDDFFKILDTPARNNLLKTFGMEKLNKINDKFLDYAKIVENINPTLIHGDIKKSNIMINEENEAIIVDCATLSLSYDVFNVRHQICWQLDSESSIAFLKGYFDGLYNFNRPENFNKQMEFIAILNFFEAATHYAYQEDLSHLDRFLLICSGFLENDYDFNI